MKPHCPFFVMFMVFVSWCSSFASAQSPLPTKPSLKPDASDAFFATGQIPKIKLVIEPPEMQKLRQDPRKYVRAKLIEDDKTEYKEVGVKLKGAAGSFRGVDDRPALTINMDKFYREQKFHGLDKFHLNNSVQDGTYMHELISSDICLAFGVPAARATHARVWLNGRDLGFYGFKEGFDTDFLQRHFKNHKGNLYDGGFCQEIDGNLEKDDGDGPNDRSDLKALVAACREPNPVLRWQKVEELLDIDAFLKFTAVELIMCHWDGYCNNRNNYRVYFEPVTKKAYFFPHGMDQMFGDTNASVMNIPGGLVANTVLQNPQWRARYRDLLTEMIKLFNPPDKLLARVDQIHARLKPVLTEINPNAARDNENHAKNLKDRLIARGKSLAQQDAQPEPRPMTFNAQGEALLSKWYTKSETADAKQEEVAVDGVKALLIAAGPSGRCVASWRTKVMLPAGNFEFQVRVKTQDVAALQEPNGTGAGIRISGGQRANKVEGTSAWQVIKQPLQGTAPLQELELVAELRASKGQVWFDLGNMKIVKLP